MWLPKSFRKWFSRRAQTPIHNAKTLFERRKVVRLSVEVLEGRVAPTVAGPVYPAPGGNTYSASGSGDIQAGGETWSYNFSANPYLTAIQDGDLYWAPTSLNDGPTSTFQGVYLGLGGSVVNGSDPAGAVNFTGPPGATTTGSTSWTNTISYPNHAGGTSTTPGGLNLAAVSGLTGNFLYGASLPSGMADNIGVAIPVTGNYAVNFEFTASGEAAATFYANNVDAPSGGTLFSKFSGASGISRTP